MVPPDEGTNYQQVAHAYAADVGVLGILQAVSRLRGLILLPIIARGMGTAAYGVWSQSLVAVGVGGALIGLQLPSALVRYVAGTSDADKQRDVFFPQLAILVILGVLVSVASWLVPGEVSSVLFGDAAYHSIAKWIGIWVAFAAVGGLGMDLQRALHRVKLYGVLTTGLVLLQLFVVGGTVLATHDLELAVASAVFLEGVVALGVLAKAVRDLGLGWPDFGTLRRSLTFSLPLIPSYYGGIVLNYADRMMIAWLYGPESVGIYSAAYSLARVVGEVYRPIRSALMPTATRLWDRGDTSGCQGLLTNTLRYYLILAIPAAIGASLLGSQILAFLSKDVFNQNIGWIILFLALGAFQSNLQMVFATQLELRQETKPLAVSKTISAALYAGLIAVAVPTWGLIGAAVTTSLGYFLDLAIISSISLRRSAFALPFRSAVKATCAALLMIFPVAVLRNDSLLGVLSAMIAGMATYVVAMIVMGGIGRRELAFLLSLAHSSPT